MFYNEKPIKAVRKARGCQACCIRIEVGEAAIGCAGHYDGQFWAGVYHRDCREAEIGLNKLHDVWGGDEWMNLSGDIEWDDWPWLIEAFPAVAARMGITTERFNRAQAEREATRKAWAEIDAKRYTARIETRRAETLAAPFMRAGSAAETLSDTPTPAMGDEA